MQKIYNLPILAVPGDQLQILVENQGRVNYGSGINDFKVTISLYILRHIYLYFLFL
jgi:hypothetical protein